MVTFDEKTRYINIIKGISVVLIYFLFSLFNTLPIELLHINYSSLPVEFRMFYSITMELIMLAIIYMIFAEQYKKAWQDLKKNHRKYFNDNLKFYIFGVIVMMVANSVILILGGTSSDNETGIRSQFALHPIYTYISAVFLAPVLEESVFRLGFRNIFKNKFVFIFISSLIFGGLHLIGMLNSPLILLYLISYCSCGIAFAYMMTKTNNIFVSMGFHFMHNGILMALQFFPLLFG